MRGGSSGQEEFKESGLKAARDMATAWRLEYSHRRPHGALGYLTPAVYAAWQRHER